MEKVDFFRKKYPKFIFEKYSYEISGNNLGVLFDFKIEPDIHFTPKITIENIDKKRLSSVGNRILNNLIFHLGLMEIPSYWKPTCSPEILIRAGYLNEEQIKWWKDLIMKGMGQFFYENKINFKKPNFLKIKSSPLFHDREKCTINEVKLNSNGILVPIGGGKDSIVTLEILKKAKKELSSFSLNCFSLNPTDAAKKIMDIGSCKNPIIVERKIDSRLLELNRKGFLNGHTPFSAYLAFLSVLVAVIFGQKYITFSNERSSNEGNLKYLEKIINHQYSKSFDFEKKFRDYSKKYLAKDIEYFSFLRPLYEIQIAKLLSQYPKYFATFLSCNVAFQTDSGRKKPMGKWCGKCPKCLFIFACLYPFIETKKLIKIFGKNLFEDRKLLQIMLQLIGERGFKPFECVGTKKESLIAFYLSYKKYGEQFSVKLPFLLKKYTGRTRANLPFLLRYFEKKILPKYPNLEKDSKRILNSWNNQNNLPKGFERILKTYPFS